MIDINTITLLPHQFDAMEQTRTFNKCAYYLDMGLGKTFVGSEKARVLGLPIIIVCPLSMIETWENHFKTFYPDMEILKGKKLMKAGASKTVTIVNYDIVWRRDIFKTLEGYTLMLDESSYIKNPRSNRSKFILKMKPENVILLSGTPTGGKYEELWSQCKLLGWNITERKFLSQFTNTIKMDIGGFKIDKIVGYKNVPRLKRKLAEHGCVFMKTDEVYTLPEQLDHFINIKPSKELKTFMVDSYIKMGDIELMGDTVLNKMLYERQLSSMYSKDKLDKLKNILESTSDRVIVFYNFEGEFLKISELCMKLKKPISFVNGRGKDLNNYNDCGDSITLIQYQAGAMGLNLQKSNKIIYFSLTQSSELYEQSRKRTNRIGQSRTCHYYHLIVDGSIEEKIFACLKTRNDFTSQLFQR